MTPADAAIVRRKGIVEPELARDLAPSAGLRNRLVHEYDAIDDARVLQAIEHFLARAGH